MSNVELRDITLAYNRRPAVHHLNGTFKQGSLTALVGPNGSGKSTLLAAILGQIQPISGSIDRGTLGPQDIGYLSQSPSFDVTFPMSTCDFVRQGRFPRTGIFRSLSPADDRVVKKALHDVGLSGCEDRSLDQLSGGQLQRARFARLLVQDAELILLDEPFNSLDTRSILDLEIVVRKWFFDGRTIIIVMHDVDAARALCPETLLLAREKIAWGPSLAALTPDNLRKAQMMVEHWVQNPRWCEHSHVAH